LGRCASEISANKDFARLKYPRRVINYICNPFNLIDLVAFLPYYINLIVKSDGAKLSVLRLVRLVRILLIPELGNLHEKAGIFFGMVSRLTMYFVVFLIFSSFAVVIFASLEYYVERGNWDPETGRYLRQNLYYLGPDQPSIFVSIPDSFWWYANVLRFWLISVGKISHRKFRGFFLVPFMIAGLLFRSRLSAMEASFFPLEQY
jgi:potassium voltage-gated channel Shal-related subfamily D protein 2